MTRHRVRMFIGLLAVAAIGALPAGAAAQEEELPAVGVQTIAEGLTSPVALVPPGDGSGRLFVADQAGLIRVLAPDGTLLEEPFLDLRDRMVPLMAGFDERGLLGLAFHPQYARNGRFYVYYSAPLRAGGPAGFNHNAGALQFGPDDGNLYISLGDGAAPTTSASATSRTGTPTTAAATGRT